MVIGQGIVLKVMAGDHVNANVLGSYDNTAGSNNPFTTTPLEQLIAGLFGSGIGATGTHGGMSLGTGSGSLLLPGILDFLGTVPDNYTPSGAYLNWVLLDGEQFKLVTDNGNSGFEQLQEGGGDCTPAAVLQINAGDGIDIAKNGYLYIFVSNTSDAHPVYFDQLHVEHVRGPLVEETHYYPFGLTMAGISSKAANSLNNHKKYQGYENNTDFDLNVHETFFRVHDPQIGRWWQIDPKPESGFELSPYLVMNNNPISITDPLGDVVDYERGEGVTKKQFRQFKREIRQMRRNSESFAKIFKGFKNDSKVFKYVATNTSSGGETTKSSNGYNMNISIHGKDPNQGGDEKLSTIGQIAHETGHAFRSLIIWILINQVILKLLPIWMLIKQQPF